MTLLKLLSLLTIIGLLSSISLGQTVHQVAAGENTLYDAVQAATSGDIIELVDDGGVYLYTLDSDKIEVDKVLTIRAADGLTNRPIIRNDRIGSSSTSTRNLEVIAGGSLNLIGIEFDGSRTGDGVPYSKQAIRMNSGDSTFLKIYDCYFHDYTENFMRGYATTLIDTFIMENSIATNALREGFTFYSSSGDGADLNYVLFENNTITKCGREAIQFGSMAAGFNPEVIINHCTFDSTSTALATNDRVIRLWGHSSAIPVTNATITNCIMSNQMGTNSESVELYGTSTISYTDTFNVRPVDLQDMSSIGLGMLDVDPMYTDPANLDYTLQSGSPVLGQANDGWAMGDLRWDPTVGLPKTYYVESGTDVLKPVVDAAAEGDTIELVTSGGLYLSADQMVIDKDLVIRARSGLAQKPILKYIGTSTGAYMFKVESSPKVRFYGIEFDGDGTGEGGAALAKYALRLDNGDSTGTMDIRVMDCVMHDFNEKIIKPYGNCGMDSLIVHNTIFYNGTKEGVTLYSGSSSDPAVRLDYAEFYNCTFYGFAREGIKADTNPNTVMRVNQCTFYDCGGTGKSFIFVDDLLDAEIKNSIFVKNAYSSYFARLESPANSFHHNVFFDVASHQILNGDSVSVTDTLFADPLFADPMNADFTLDATSPARTAGEGGTPAGDLRWAIDPNSVLLSVVTVGQGIVTLDPPGNIYDPGTMVTLTAIPDLGWEFDQWSGDDPPFPPDLNPRVVTVNSNMTVIATFVNLTPQVTLTIDSIGLGSVVANPEPGDDGTYDLGETVELTAVPAVDWAFVEWLGDVTSTDNPVTFTVDSNMTVTASFLSTLTQFSLNTTIVGNGNVLYDPEPIIDTYDTNTVVQVTAVPAIGWLFDGWTGDLTISS